MTTTFHTNCKLQSKYHRVEKNKIPNEKGMTISQFKANFKSIDTDSEFIHLHEIC